MKIDGYLLYSSEKADVSVSHFDFEPRFAGFGTEKAGNERVYLIDFALRGNKEAKFILEK